MENREILIANTKTQKRSKIITDASTLGELKAALNAAGVDYYGMTFTEGISKTQLLEDNTQLPQNVMYKGQPTNNLVILLTNTKKNISSGIHAADRQAAYSIIKDYGFQEDIKEVFGRNFTQVPTTDLQKFIEDRTENSTSTVDDYDDCDDYDDEAETEKMDAYVDNSEKVEHSIKNLIECLFTCGILDADNLVNLTHDMNTLLGCSPSKESTPVRTPVTTSDGSITDDDIDNMISDLHI